MREKYEILKEITDFYLNSHDFNGISVRSFLESSNNNLNELKKRITSLIQENKISLNFGDRHPNPHIKALWEETAEIQIRKLKSLNLHHVCAYPTKTHLKGIIDQSQYQNKPFTLRLALGEPQVSYLSFGLSVLEFYRNDPRYYYNNNDISGSIVVHDEFYETLSESDRIGIQSFGFSYDSNFNRAVAVILRYLSMLSSEHQQIWNAKRLNGDFKLHPDYSKIIRGFWDIGVSIFKAFIEELYHINRMCELMNRPCLFRKDFKNDKPRNFGFLIRPTSKEYYDFILLLDKMISENINRDFFLDEVSFNSEHKRKDGKTIISPKNSLTLLDEWLKAKYKIRDRSPIQDMINIFKTIRKLRQNPAHMIDDNKFNQKHFKLQRDIIIKAYEGLRILRVIFSSHPYVKGYELPDWLESGTIWRY